MNSVDGKVVATAGAPATQCHSEVADLKDALAQLRAGDSAQPALCNCKHGNVMPDCPLHGAAK